MLGRTFLCVAALALVAPAIQAQQQSRPDKQPNNWMQRQQQQLNRQASVRSRAAQLGDRQAWLNSLTDQAKLRDKLAEAWQTMGVSQQLARTIADAYDPARASQMHHTSLRGKSNEEIAALLQSALSSKRYLVADQLLIDYQRAKLSLGEMAQPDAGHIVTGR